MTKTSTRESGFTLLELLLVIGVAALLLIGGIATYRMVSDGNKTTDATRMLLSIRQAAQTMSQQQGGTYTGITFTTTPATPDSPLVGAGVLASGQRNPFAGNINITAPSATQSQIQFTNLPKSACIRLMQAITNPNELVSVAGTSGAAITGANLPVQASAAATSCNNAAANTVTWIFP